MLRYPHLGFMALYQNISYWLSDLHGADYHTTERTVQSCICRTMECIEYTLMF